MMHAVILVGVALALLLILEILNALYDSVIVAVGRDAAESSSRATPIWAAPFVIVRMILGFVAAIGRTTSLIVHESAHALAQLVFGGRPRIVLLKNGGYAQARPWLNLGPARWIYVVGAKTGLGIICVAPILVGAALLVIALVALTPMVGHDIVDAGRSLGADSVHRWHDVTSALATSVSSARWWAYPILVAVPLLLAAGMTPSSVDYAIGWTHLVGYAVAVAICAGVAEHHRDALLVVAPISAIAGYAGSWRGPRRLSDLVASIGLGTAVIAIAIRVAGGSDGAYGALSTGLGVLVLALGIAAIVYVGITSLFLALSLISVRPKTLWYALIAAPRALVDIVLPFYTCDTCRVHYRGHCEGCGRTPDGPTPDAAARP